MAKLVQNVSRIPTKRERITQNLIILLCMVVAALLYAWSYYLDQYIAVIVFFAALSILLAGFVWAAKHRQDFRYEINDDFMTITESVMRKDKKIFTGLLSNITAYNNSGNNKSLRELKQEYDNVLFAGRSSDSENKKFLLFRQEGKNTLLIITPDEDVDICIRQTIGELSDDDRG